MLLSNDPDLDLDAKNHRGYSALMLAVYNGQRDFCEALLRAGADPNSMDLMGNTVLMASAFKGNLEMVKLLLQHGAAVTYKNHANMNVRDWAVMFGRTEVVEFFDRGETRLDASSRIRTMLRFIKLSALLLWNKRNSKSEIKPNA